MEWSGESVPLLDGDLAQRALETLRAEINEPEQLLGACNLIGRLPHPVAILFAGEVHDLAAGNDYLNSQQLSALLAAESAAAEPYIAEGLAAGEPASFMALKDHSEAGRRLIGELAPGPSETKQGNLCLDLLRLWGGAEPEDVHLLRKLLDSEDRAVAYRAMGYLLALGEGGETEFEALKQAVLGQTTGWVGAIEGIKISGDPRFAGVLVPLASQAELQTEIADGDRPAGEPGEDEFIETDTVRMAAYALTYLPGEQAALVRTKLLAARSPRLRWQARLGQLLHGNPEAWHNAITAEGYADPDLWTALEPPEARNPDLLPLYAAVAHGDDALLQVRAAVQLNRYNGIASGNRVARILSKLIDAGGPGSDLNREVAPLVRLKALETAGDLRLPHLFAQVQGIMDNADDDNALYRPLAAYYLLAVGRLPEPGPGAEEKGSDR